MTSDKQTKKGIKLLSTPPPQPSYIYGTSGSSLQTLLESPAFSLHYALNWLQCFLSAQAEFELHANQEAFKVTFTITIFSTSCQHPWRTQEEGLQHPDSGTPSRRKLCEQTIWADMAAFLSLSQNVSTAQALTTLLYYLIQISQPSRSMNLKMLTKNIQLHKYISFPIFYLLDSNLHTNYLKSLESQQLRIAGSWTNIFCLKTHFGQLRLKISTAFYPTSYCCPHQCNLNDLMFFPKGWVRLGTPAAIFKDTKDKTVCKTLFLH